MLDAVEGRVCRKQSLQPKQIAQDDRTNTPGEVGMHVTFLQGTHPVVTVL